MKMIRWTNGTAAALAMTAVLAGGVTGCKKPVAVDDATLTAQVQQKLAADAALASEPVQVTTANGVVVLTGSVSNAAAKGLAASDASSVTGVDKVINSITVNPATAPVSAAAVTPQPTVPLAPVSKPKELVRPVKKADPEPMPVRNVPQPAPVVRNSPPPPPAQQYAPQPQQPVVRTVTLPSGTTLPVRVTQTLDSETTQPGESFTGAVATDIVQDGMVLIPRGATVNGRVVEVHEAGHFKGSSLLTVELTSVNARGERISVSTEPYSVQGKGRGKNTAVKTGVGAAAGAILGGIFGGGKGAAIGAAAGGGTGAGINAVTRGEQVQIPSESVVRFTLTNSVAVRTSTRAGYGSNGGMQDR